LIAKIRELKERRRLTILMTEQNFNQAIRIAEAGPIKPAHHVKECARNLSA
jgi:branched-chain amino acid transport system ATP-binding protein